MVITPANEPIQNNLHGWNELYPKKERTWFGLNTQTQILHWHDILMFRKMFNLYYRRKKTHDEHKTNECLLWFNARCQRCSYVMDDGIEIIIQIRIYLDRIFHIMDTSIRIYFTIWTWTWTCTEKMHLKPNRTKNC